MVGPTWNRANAFADGAAEPRGGGLTGAGRELIERMAELGVALDLAHLSRRACSEALEVASGPVLASHANADAVFASARNLPDDVLAEIGRRDGVVGLNFVPPFVGDGPSAERVADHHAHIARVAGPHATAIGADFVGFLPPSPSRRAAACRPTRTRRWPARRSRRARPPTPTWPRRCVPAASTRRPWTPSWAATRCASCGACWAEALAHPHAVDAA